MHNIQPSLFTLLIKPVVQNTLGLQTQLPASRHLDVFTIMNYSIQIHAPILKSQINDPVAPITSTKAQRNVMPSKINSMTCSYSYLCCSLYAMHTLTVRDICSNSQQIHKSKSNSMSHQTDTIIICICTFQENTPHNSPILAQSVP